MISLRYAPRLDDLKSKWKARNEAFCEYMTFKYRYDTGKSLTCEPDGMYRNDDKYPKYAESVDSQVVVDFSEASAANPMWQTHINKLKFEDHCRHEDLSEDYNSFNWKRRIRHVSKRVDEIYYDGHIDTKLKGKLSKRDRLLREASYTDNYTDHKLDDEYLILLPNRVFAFVMKSRKWGKHPPSLITK